MTDSDATLFRTSALSHRKVTRFRLRPDAEARAGIAAEMNLVALPELSFEGEIAPSGRADFTLTGRLRAHAVQACIVSLAPVQALIDEAVNRRYLAEYTLPEGDEAEMPEDDSAEPMPDSIDLMAVLRETLALALPLYPRAEGVELGEAVFAAEGTEPLRDEDLRPFAGLASLVARDSEPKE